MMNDPQEPIVFETDEYTLVLDWLEQFRQLNEDEQDFVISVLGDIEVLSIT
jgi:hypothetical protein